MRWISLILLFVAVDAWALVEIPANGVDDDGSGGDAAGPEGDADLDGYCAAGYEGCYYAGTDCDDTNGHIYPGVQIATGCSGSDYKTCQSDGSYTSCTTGPLAEGTRNYYVNPATGSDTTGDGSYANPWATFRKVCSYYSAGQRPSGWIGLTADDYVYLVGNTDLNARHDYNVNELSACKLRTVNASSGNPVVFKRYPGSTAKIDMQATYGSDNAAGFVILQSSYITLDNFEITGVTGSGVAIEEATYVDVGRVTIYDVDGEEDNNVSAFSSTAGSNVTLHHSKLYDTYDQREPAGNELGNNSNIVFFHSTSGTGVNTKVLYNMSYYTAAWDDSGSNARGNTLKVKHTNSLASYLFKGNRLWNSYAGGIEVGANDLIAEDNFIAGARSCIGYKDLGGTTIFSDGTIFRYNTCIDTDSAIDYQPVTTWAAVESPGWENNVFRVLSSAVSVSRYGDATLYTDVVGGGKLDNIQNNCYYDATDSSLTNGFCLFCGNPGPDGATYNFAGWQSAGYDAGSSNQTQTFDSMWRATNGDCDDKGWMRGINATSSTIKGSMNFRAGGRL